MKKWLVEVLWIVLNKLTHTLRLRRKRPQK